MEDKIISALIGLVGACGNNPKTENTDRLVIKALATMQDANAAKDMIGEIREEKNRISPGCAVCKTPCGNTSDYDMRRIYNAKDEIRKTKLHIVSEIEETAEYVYRNTVPTSETETEFFYKALSYISFDLEKDTLLSLLAEAQEMNRKIKGKNNL